MYEISTNIQRAQCNVRLQLRFAHTHAHTKKYQSHWQFRRKQKKKQQHNINRYSYRSLVRSLSLSQINCIEIICTICFKWLIMFYSIPDTFQSVKWSQRKRKWGKQFPTQILFIHKSTHTHRSQEYEENNMTEQSALIALEPSVCVCVCEALVLLFSSLKIHGKETVSLCVCVCAYKCLHCLLFFLKCTSK